MGLKSQALAMVIVGSGERWLVKLTVTLQAVLTIEACVEPPGHLVPAVASIQGVSQLFVWKMQ